MNVRYDGRALVERSWFGPAADPNRKAFQLNGNGDLLSHPGHITSVENWFDGVPNPGSLGTLSFTPPYTFRGVPMSRARHDQVIALAGVGSIPLTLPTALEGS